MKNKMMFLLALILTGGILSLSGCATTAAANTDADVAVIKALGDSYSAAVMAGDAERFLSLWMANGIKMSQGAVPVIGVENMRAATVKNFQTNNIKMVVNVEEVIVSGNLAVGRGLYTKQTTPKAGGATVNFNGKFLTIYKRQPDGGWKIYIDNSSSNTP